MDLSGSVRSKEMTADGPRARDIVQPALEDFAAFDQLEKNEDERLDTVRGRAEKWLGAITGITGLVSTVLIIEGPDSARDLTTHARYFTAGFLAVALLSLAYATYKAYSAAYGEPGEFHEIATDEIAGLARRLRLERRNRSKAVLASTRIALEWTAVGLFLLLAGVGITWFGPTGGSPGEKTRCILIEGEVVAELDGSAISLARLDEDAALSDCP